MGPELQSLLGFHISPTASPSARAQPGPEWRPSVYAVTSSEGPSPSLIPVSVLCPPGAPPGEAGLILPIPWPPPVAEALQSSANPVCAKVSTMPDLLPVERHASGRHGG